MNKEQESAKLKALVKAMETNFEILKNAVEKTHVPNTFATSQALLYALKELDKLAEKRYRQWKDGEDF